MMTSTFIIYATAVPIPDCNSRAGLPVQSPYCNIFLRERKCSPDPAARLSSRPGRGASIRYDDRGLPVDLAPVNRILQGQVQRVGSRLENGLGLDRVSLGEELVELVLREG